MGLGFRPWVCTALGLGFRESPVRFVRCHEHKSSDSAHWLLLRSTSHFRGCYGLSGFKRKSDTFSGASGFGVPGCPSLEGIAFWVMKTKPISSGTSGFQGLLHPSYPKPLGLSTCT